MTTERTATEVILELEQKVDHLTKIVQSYDGILKMILNSVNSKKAAVAVPTAVPLSVPDSARTAEFEKITETVKGKFAEAKEKYGIVDDDEPVDFAPRNGFRKIDRAAAMQPQTVAVTQQLLINNQPMVVAAVEIKDSNNRLISSSRTNQKGFWVSSLEPGEYTVFVLKRFTKEKRNPLEHQYKIVVPASEGSLTLESLNL